MVMTLFCGLAIAMFLLKISMIWSVRREWGGWAGLFSVGSFGVCEGLRRSWRVTRLQRATSVSKLKNNELEMLKF